MAVKKLCQAFARSCFILFYFFCANNHLNNVTAVEESDTFPVTASDRYLVLTEV